jgi:hypothetical protein
MVATGAGVPCRGHSGCLPRRTSWHHHGLLVAGVGLLVWATKRRCHVAVFVRVMTEGPRRHTQDWRRAFIRASPRAAVQQRGWASRSSHHQMVNACTACTAPLGRCWHQMCRRPLVVKQLETHSVVDFVVLQRDVVLEDGVPLLQPDLLGPRACNADDRRVRAVRVAIGACSMEQADNALPACHLINSVRHASTSV